MGGHDKRHLIHIFKALEVHVVGEVGRILQPSQGQGAEVVVHPISVALQLHGAEDPVVGMFLHQTGQLAQGIRHHPRVLVHQIDIVVAVVKGVLKPLVVGLAETHVLVVLYQDGVGIMRFDIIRGAIRGTVIDNNDIWTEGRVLQTGETSIRPFHSVVCDDDSKYLHVDKH